MPSSWDMRAALSLRSKNAIPKSSNTWPRNLAEELTEAFESYFEPTTITLTGEDSPTWQLFSGTVKATYNAQRGLEGEDNIFVSPGVLTGNTGRCPSPVLFTRVDHDHSFEALLESHVTLSGTATQTRESLRVRRTTSTPLTNVRIDPSSEFGSHVLTSSADIRADNFVETIRFYTTLILNADESREM